jgi:hypothetical protein
VVVALTAQFAMGWAIRTDRVPLRDPLYQEKLALLRESRVFEPGGPAHRAQTVLFLGSSRTLGAIDAGAVGPELSRRLGRRVAAFNFGVHGAGPLTSALYLRRLFAEGVRPDAVVIEVHPAFLAAQTPEPPEARWLAPIRLRPEEVPLARRLGLPATESSAHGWRGRLLPWYEYRAPMIDRYAPPLSAQPFPLGPGRLGNASGFLRGPGASPRARAELLAATHKQYADFFPGYAPGGYGLAALRDSLETCRAARTPAALVLTPESSGFRGWYPEPGRSRIAPLLNELASEFGCVLFDTRDWLTDELVPDGHHLTGPGADAFTARLTRDSLAPWLASGEGGVP